MATPNVTLKLLIDTKNNKVIFAEAGKDVVDFLFKLMALPLGTVTSLLESKSMLGCLGDLYESIQILSQNYIEEGKDKNSVLKPTIRSNDTPMLLPNLKSISPEVYLCPKSCSSGMFAANAPNQSCRSCGQTMYVRIDSDAFAAKKTNETKRSSGGGGLVKGAVSYMVMDNLEVSPVSTISSVSLLRKLDLNVVEEKVVEFGMTEGLELLKASLQTKSVLTSIFLKMEDCKVTGGSLKRNKRG